MSGWAAQHIYRDFVCTNGTVLSVTARCSQKAKNQKVILHNSGMLEVVVPVRRGKAEHEITPSFATGFLEEKRSWIERAARSIAPQIDAYRLSRAAGVPTHLEFPPLDELWLIEYHRTPAARITTKTELRALQPSNLNTALHLPNPDVALHLSKPDNTFDLSTAVTTRHPSSPDTIVLHLHGPIDNEALCFETIRRFVTAYAKDHLPGFAWRVVGELEAAGQLQKRPTSITVNNRKSAWGVCTRDGRIRLDRRLIFLPHDLARQVVLHELAHIRNMNHSQAFYDEFYSFDGATREATKALKQASCYVPAWFSDTIQT